MNSVKKEKIIITGAGGFLGSNIVDSLKDKEEYHIYALSSHGESMQQENNCKSVQYLHKDKIFDDSWKHILQGAVVINCAFPRNANGFEMADGLNYIQRLFDKSVECDAKAIINISSQSVYSQYHKEPATEETPVCLESPYAVGKYMTELMLESICKFSTVCFTNLRMSSLIGPKFDQRIVNKLIAKALTGESITIVNSNKIFGFLDVKDAVYAILSLLSVSSQNWKKVYNVGNGEGYTIRDIYKIIKKVFSLHNISFPETNFEYEDNNTSSSISGEKLFMDSGFKATISMEESVETILNTLISK